MEEAKVIQLGIRDRVNVRGRLELIFMKGDYPMIIGSNIMYDPERTQIVHVDDGHNLVVDDGRLVLNQMVAGELPGNLESDPITYFCTGTGGYTGTPNGEVDPNPPTGADRDLYEPLAQLPITSKSHPNSLATTFITTIGKSESIGNLTEFGLKTRSGRLFCRRTTRPRYKDSEVFFVARWTIQF